MEKLLRHVIPFLTSIVGTSLVLFSVYLMNESNKTTLTPTEKKSLSFQVKKKPPPKKIKKEPNVKELQETLQRKLRLQPYQTVLWDQVLTCLSSQLTI